MTSSRKVGNLFGYSKKDTKENSGSSRIPQFSVSGEEFIDNLIEENKKLNEEKEFFYKSAKQFREENEKLKETIKDHQLYEEKLEHRIIELEELLHGE